MSAPPRTALTRLAREAAAHARDGALTLQVCDECERVQYPYREVCGRCLSDRLQWREVDGSGELVASAAVHASAEAFFREHAPWPIASVALTAGPTVIAHLEAAGAAPGEPVRVHQTFVDPAQCVLVARLQSNEEQDES